MRTEDEIVARIESIKDDDFFGWETTDLMVCLSFEKAKPYLKESVSAEEFANIALPRDRESVVARMRDYMDFAWEKANDGRGLSAGRSMSHYSAWVWLAGDDLGDLGEYNYYGKDNLRRICELYGWDADQWDNGVRVNS